MLPPQMSSICPKGKNVKNQRQYAIYIASVNAKGRNIKDVFVQERRS
jgi:hypothetical protein